MPKKDATTDDVAREVEQSGALCLAFANSAVPRSDGRTRAKSAPRLTLRGYDDLVVWGQRMGALDGRDGEALARTAAARPELAVQVLAKAVELRAALLRIFTALAAGRQPAPRDLRSLNEVLAASAPGRRIVPGPAGFRWEWVDDGQGLERVLWPVARSAGDLLASPDHRRLRQCAGSGCRQLFIDRNRRRLWCDMNLCGNQAKRRRSRARRSALGLSPEPR